MRFLLIALMAVSVSASADILFAIDTNGGTFTDTTAEYVDAIDDYDSSITVDTIAAPASGPIPFPGTFTTAEYDLVIVCTAENWWTAPDNFQSEDATELIGYASSATGANPAGLLVIGWDLIWGYQPGWGSPNDGLFDTYGGLTGVSQDYTAVTEVDWTGEGVLAGLGGTSLASYYTISPTFYLDELTGGTAAATDDAGGEVIVQTNETGDVKWSFSCLGFPGDWNTFYDVIAAYLDWYLAGGAIESASLGEIKASFR